MIKQIWKNIFGSELTQLEGAYTYTFPRGENMTISELTNKLTRLNSTVESSLQVSLHLDDGRLVLVLREVHLETSIEESEEEVVDEATNEEPVQEEDVEAEPPQKESVEDEVEEVPVKVKKISKNKSNNKEIKDEEND